MISPRQPISPRFAALPPATKGMVWALTGIFLFTLLGAVVKVLGGRLDSFQIAFFRSFGAFVALLPVVFITGPRQAFYTKRLGRHLSRSLTGVAAIACGFYALVHLPLADVTALGFTKPLFLVPLAALLLGETVRWRRTLAILVGFCGVLIMARPGQSGFDPTLGVALADAFISTFSAIHVKKLAETERPLTMVIYLSLFASIFLLIPALVFWQAPTGEEYLLLGAIGLLGALGQACIVCAYKTGEATAITSLEYAKLPLAVFLGWIMFAELPDLWSLCGAIIIIGSTCYIAYREAQLGKRRPPTLTT